MNTKVQITPIGFQSQACTRQRYALFGKSKQVCGALALGIDFGTSGVRATVVNEQKEIVQEVKGEYLKNESVTDAWKQSLFSLLGQLDKKALSDVSHICIDGTSSTCLLVCKNSGTVLTTPKMYNEVQSQDCVEFVEGIAPLSHTTRAATSTLCKLCSWHLQNAWQDAQAKGYSPTLLHQADWAASFLHGSYSTTDYNNALKLGFDPSPSALSYPNWLTEQPFAHVLPDTVLPPGTPALPVLPDVANATGLNTSAMVCAGTTDSIAAFLAAGLSEPGESVTSLGSTLAVKLISHQRVDDASMGIYSHRLGEWWLVGGASNSGGVVLRQHFSDQELQDLTPLLTPDQSTGLDYYPLTCRGERFPVNDPQAMPKLDPKPDEPHVFLQGILEGIARIEQTAYSKLKAMGATPVKRVVTCGGGAANPAWIRIRQNLLQVPVEKSYYGEASYGSALLALRKGKF